MKCAIIGIDAITLDLVEKFTAEGSMPNLKALMERGVATQAYSSEPPITATNWNTIVTGAHAGTHGVTGMEVLLPGHDLDDLQNGFDSGMRVAETIYEAAARQGINPLLIKYSTSWPPTIDRGWQVEGYCDPGYTPVQVAGRAVFTTDELPLPTVLVARQSHRITVEKADGWKNLPDSTQPPLQVRLPIVPMRGMEVLTDNTKILWALLFAGEGGYDRAVFTAEKDAKGGSGAIAVGEWCDYFKAMFDIGEKKVEGALRAKLVSMSPDGKQLKIVTSRVAPVEGYTYPAELSAELNEKVGFFREINSLQAMYENQWIDEDTFLEELDDQIKWMSGAARHLMSTKDWGVFCTQWHGTDHMGHNFVGLLDPDCLYYDPAREELAWHMEREAYRMGDKYIGAVLENMTGDDVVVVVSDHGMLGSRMPKKLAVNDMLEKAGLLAFKKQNGGQKKVDWSKSKAYMIQNRHLSYVYVNLKGRQPSGIVEPGEEYEAVRQQVMQILWDMRDPQTETEPMFAVVLRSEDAEVFGLYGDRVGDVFFAPRADTPVVDEKVPAVVPGERIAANGDHAFLNCYNNARIGSVLATAVFAGPGIKRGLTREHPIHLVDIVPTVSHLLGIEPPRQCEGAVLYDLLE